jgi:hypothetical protein
MHTQEQLNNMSVVEKATLLNQLRCQVFTGTEKEDDVRINMLFESYNKETNILMDSIIWRLYGLHYKDYIDVIGHILTYCPFKLEKAIDKKILYWQDEIAKKAVSLPKNE